MDQALKDQIKALGQEILAKFLTDAKGVTLSPDEQGIVERATERLAECTILSLGATDQQKADLVTQRDLALAAMANIGVAKAIEADRIMRQSAMDVVSKVLSFVLKVGISAAVAL